MNKTHRMPLLFVGHGNPMNAIENTPYTAEWERIGKSLLPPKAIVCMSAHWLTTGSYITSNQHPKIIYDFYGFPDKLYHVNYSVVGSPQLAERVHTEQKHIKPSTLWGVDHGAWSVLKRMFPDASIPVLQLSIDYASTPEEQIELMHTIAHLRNEGILFIGSGNIVHNLGLAQPQHTPFEWAEEFEARCIVAIQKGDTSALLQYKKWGQSAHLAVPMDDHYRPMLNSIALAQPDEQPHFFNRGIDMASISMLSFMYL